jgi:hypothetical protein
MEEHGATESVTSVDLAQDTGDTGSDQDPQPTGTLTDQISDVGHEKPQEVSTNPFSAR